MTKAEAKKERNEIQAFLTAFHADPDGLTDTEELDAREMQKLFARSAGLFTEAQLLNVKEQCGADEAVAIVPMEDVVCDMLICGFIMGRAFERRQKMEREFSGAKA